ncbi:MAG: hypothetical protein ACM31C_12075 [Acidobacteriota bacterium]
MEWEGWTYTLELAAFVLGMLALTIVVMVWMYRRDQRKLHAVRRVRIADLVEGQRARVVGTAVSVGETVDAPHSGTKCLACRAWQYSADYNYRPPPDDVRLVRFQVRDDSGTIEVSVKHAKLQLQGHEIDGQANPIGNHLLHHAGIHVWEDRLATDDQVAVTGFALRRNDGALYLAGSDDSPLTISNKDDALVDS